MITSINIPVDDDTIKTGINRASAYCVIAEAIRRALPHVTNISVDLRTIRWSDKTKGSRYVFLTPVSAAQVIVDFDQGKTERLKPFTLRLRGAQIIKIKTEMERRQNRGAGKGKSERVPRRLILPAKGHVADIIGGTPPQRSPMSPSRDRVFGRKDLVP